MIGSGEIPQHLADQRDRDGRSVIANFGGERVSRFEQLVRRDAGFVQCALDREAAELGAGEAFETAQQPPDRGPRAGDDNGGVPRVRHIVTIPAAALVRRCPDAVS